MLLLIALPAYVPEAGDKSSYDEYSSCSVGGAFPIETAPPNLKDFSPTEKWNFVSKGFAGWAPQLLVPGDADCVFNAITPRRIIANSGAATELSRLFVTPTSL